MEQYDSKLEKQVQTIEQISNKEKVLADKFDLLVLQQMEKHLEIRPENKQQKPQSTKNKQQQRRRGTTKEDIKNN